MSEEKRVKYYAVDFDAVISTYKGWKGKRVFGFPIDGVQTCLKLIQESGGKIIIYTTRLEIDEIKKYLSQFDIPFDYVNFSPLTQELDLHPSKIMADVYIDDRGFRFDGIWNEEVVEKIISFETYWEKERKESAKVSDYPVINLSNSGERVVGQSHRHKKI